MSARTIWDVIGESPELREAVTLAQKQAEALGFRRGVEASAKVCEEGKTEAIYIKSDACPGEVYRVACEDNRRDILDLLTAPKEEA